MQEARHTFCLEWPLTSPSGTAHGIYNTPKHMYCVRCVGLLHPSSMSFVVLCSIPLEPETTYHCVWVLPLGLSFSSPSPLQHRFCSFLMSLLKLRSQTLQQQFNPFSWTRLCCFVLFWCILPCVLEFCLCFTQRSDDIKITSCLNKSVKIV